MSTYLYWECLILMNLSLFKILFGFFLTLNGFIPLFVVPNIICAEYYIVPNNIMHYVPHPFDMATTQLVL